MLLGRLQGRFPVNSQKSILLPPVRINHGHPLPLGMTFTAWHQGSPALASLLSLTTSMVPQQGRSTCFLCSAGHFANEASKQHCWGLCGNSCIGSLLPPSLPSIQTRPRMGQVEGSCCLSLWPLISAPTFSVQTPTPFPHCKSSPQGFCQPTNSAPA